MNILCNRKQRKMINHGIRSAFNVIGRNITALSNLYLRSNLNNRRWLTAVKWSFYKNRFAAAELFRYEIWIFDFYMHVVILVSCVVRQSERWHNIFISRWSARLSHNMSSEPCWTQNHNPVRVQVALGPLLSFYFCRRT